MIAQPLPSKPCMCGYVLCHWRPSLQTMLMRCNALGKKTVDNTAALMHHQKDQMQVTDGGDGLQKMHEF